MTLLLLIMTHNELSLHLYHLFLRTTSHIRRHGIICHFGDETIVAKEAQTAKN